MMVYYWYDHQGHRTASDFVAKLQIMTGALIDGRQDSGLVRLTTPILPDESDADAEARLNEIMVPLLEKLPRFLPGR